MKKTIAIVGAVVALACASARAQTQTLIVTPQDTNSAVITVPSTNYAVINSADYDDGGQLLLNIQGASFVKDFSFENVDNLTFAGPATIQLGSGCCVPSVSYTTLEVLRNPARAPIQTLVYPPQDTNNSVITVGSNSYAVVKSADYDDGGQLLLNIQGTSFVKDYSFETVDNLTIAGPATIQLGSIPSYTTLEVFRNLAHEPVQTLIATPQATNSTVINVSSNSYAVVKSADYDDGGLLLLNVQGVSFVKDFSSESINNLTIAGPATIQLQAHCCDFVATYVTVQVVHERLKLIP